MCIRDSSRAGYTVFAGCMFAGIRTAEPAFCWVDRRSDPWTGLRSATSGIGDGAPAGLRGCQMDVTSDADVASSAEAVREWTEGAPGRRLLAVVSNAGVGTGGLFEWIPLADYERDAAVNYVGTVRVCKAFLPLLRASAVDARGGGDGDGGGAPRIVIVTSMSGKLPAPLLSSYGASKHAATAFAACIRMELSHQWGIHVCTALPSFHKTPLIDGGVPTLVRLWGALPAAIKALYGEPCATSCFRAADEMMTGCAWDPERVTEALKRVVTRTEPPPCELVVGGDALFGLQAMRHLPPPVYEAIFWYFVCWNMCMPQKAAAAGNANGKRE
eukprot:4806754-Prymnesium_polylepis.1